MVACTPHCHRVAQMGNTSSRCSHRRHLVVYRSQDSVLSAVNSFIGEYPVICSTPHVPRKGNPSAPPDYANYDATQTPQQFPQFTPVPPHSFLPQQCLHPNPPKQQFSQERSGAVTKNESLYGGFDDNIQPHMKTTDEKKGIARERERFPQSKRDRGRFLSSDSITWMIYHQ